jgi:3-deoxy-manno-octulosonate cytidylyltransferase (CMP-KDO synthetase)
MTGGKYYFYGMKENGVKIIGVIPARYQSSRFPGKPLVLIGGVPMIIHVARKTEQALGKENTFIATDDERIATVAKEYGYPVVMTSSSCKTGTDRLYEVSLQVPADVYINVQGDEPFVSPNDIIAVARIKQQHPDKIINGMCNLLPTEQPENINIPKVVVTQHNKLLYMSRLPVPGIKDPAIGIPTYKKQVCIYAFNSEELAVYGSYTSKAGCEFFEDIEILRFLDAGRDILMVETAGNTIAVDTPEDVLRAEEFFKKLTDAGTV